MAFDVVIGFFVFLLIKQTDYAKYNLPLYYNISQFISQAVKQTFYQSALYSYQKTHLNRIQYSAFYFNIPYI